MNITAPPLKLKKKDISSDPPTKLEPVDSTTRGQDHSFAELPSKISVGKVKKVRKFLTLNERFKKLQNAANSAQQSPDVCPHCGQSNLNSKAVQARTESQTISPLAPPLQQPSSVNVVSPQKGKRFDSGQAIATLPPPNVDRSGSYGKEFGFSYESTAQNVSTNGNYSGLVRFPPPGQRQVEQNTINPSCQAPPPHWSYGGNTQIGQGMGCRPMHHQRPSMNHMPFPQHSPLTNHMPFSPNTQLPPPTSHHLSPNTHQWQSKMNFPPPMGRFGPQMAFLNQPPVAQFFQQNNSPFPDTINQNGAWEANSSNNNSNNNPVSHVQDRFNNTRVVANSENDRKKHALKSTWPEKQKKRVRCRTKKRSHDQGKNNAHPDKKKLKTPVSRKREDIEIAGQCPGVLKVFRKSLGDIKEAQEKITMQLKDGIANYKSTKRNKVPQKSAECSTLVVPSKTELNQEKSNMPAKVKLDTPVIKKEPEDTKKPQPLTKARQSMYDKSITPVSAKAKSKRNRSPAKKERKPYDVHVQKKK